MRSVSKVRRRSWLFAWAFHELFWPFKDRLYLQTDIKRSYKLSGTLVGWKRPCWTLSSIRYICKIIFTFYNQKINSRLIFRFMYVTVALRSYPFMIVTFPGRLWTVTVNGQRWVWMRGHDNVHKAKYQLYFRCTIMDFLSKIKLAKFHSWDRSWTLEVHLCT